MAIGAEQPEAATGRLRWFRPRTADLVFLLFVVAAMQGAQAGGMVDDPGLGWHLRNIDAMRMEGWWLTSDPYSGPRGGQPWLTNQWLGDVALWLGWHWAGLDGIAAVAVLAIAFLLRTLFCFLLADDAPIPMAAAWTFVAALATSISWVARPNLVTIFLLMITARACLSVHSDRWNARKTIALGAMFVIWVNAHGGFLAGLTTLVVGLLTESAIGLADFDATQRWAARRRAATFAMLLAIAVSATLCNPYGWRVYPWIHTLLADEYFMRLNTEWHSPNFQAPGWWRVLFLIVLTPIVLGTSKTRPNPIGLALMAFWLAMALKGQRYVALWAVVAAPTLAPLALEIPWICSLCTRIRISDDLRNTLSRRPISQGGGATVVIAAGVLFWAAFVHRATGGFASHDPAIIPYAALDHLLEIHHGRVTFHHYDFGGYLTWHGWPKFRNWIDDRNEVQGREHIEQHFALLRTDPGWRQVLDRCGVELVCIRTGSPLDHRLADLAKGPAAEWHQKFRDDHAVIYERVSHE